MTHAHSKAHQAPPRAPEPVYVTHGPQLPDPCPFCGGQQVGVSKRGAWDMGMEHYYCKCATCGATGPIAVQSAHMYEQYSEQSLVQQAALLWSIRVAIVAKYGPPETEPPPDDPEPIAGNPWVGLVS